MPSRVQSKATLTAGMRVEFDNIFERSTDRVLNSNTRWLMDMSVSTTTRTTPFSAFTQAPHIRHWPRGSTIPTEAFDSYGWDTDIYEWGIRVPMSKFDRKDDQTQSMLRAASQAGDSSARLPQRFAMDLLQASPNTLPGIPNAADGVAMFSATDAAGRDRFGVSGGNIVTGTGVASLSTIVDDYYSAMQRFRQYTDRPVNGQPRFNPSILDGGVYIIAPAQLEQVMEEAFRQLRQGILIGTDAGVTPSNVILDTNRGINFWFTSELTDASDWYIGLVEGQQPTYFLNREGVREFSAVEGDNNSDHVRNTGEEYMQWEMRAGAGIGLPDAIIKVNNS